MPAGAIVLLLGTIVVAAAGTACSLRGGSAVAGQDQQALSRAVAELRRRMRVRRQDGFVLSTERAPILRRCAVMDRLQVSFSHCSTTGNALATVCNER